MGRSGTAAAELLLNEGCRVSVLDDRNRSELSGELAPLQGRIAGFWSGEELLGHDGLNELDVLVVSPGVPDTNPVVRETLSRGIPVYSELELASRRVEGPLLVVTGTNGKSTTVSLIHHLLITAGKSSLLAGNIGTALSSVVEDAKPGVFAVVEASSFQLEHVESLHPEVAVLLNLAPDHLNRYPDLKSYAQAKSRMLQRMDEDDAFVFPRGEVWAEAWSAVCSSRKLRFQPAPITTGEDGTGLAEDWLVQRSGGREERILLASALPLLGHHNLLNALAALAALLPYHLPAAMLAEGIRGFKGLPHRVELVGEISQVRYVNDSKATNVHAALAALNGLTGPFVMLLGGQGKGEDYQPLAAAMTQVRTAICYGEEADAIVSSLQGAVQLRRAEGMLQALEMACEIAVAGDTVLLSPACTSYDEFSSFVERGEVFTQWVKEKGGRA
jgi:UDP-N-acetylmuramoylalanine--D-glutamate ligase